MATLFEALRLANQSPAMPLLSRSFPGCSCKGLVAREDNVPCDFPARCTGGESIADLKQTHQCRALIGAWLVGLPGIRRPLLEGTSKTGCRSDAGRQSFVMWETKDRALLFCGMQYAEAQPDMGVTEDDMMGLRCPVLSEECIARRKQRPMVRIGATDLNDGRVVLGPPQGRVRSWRGIGMNRLTQTPCAQTVLHRFGGRKERWRENGQDSLAIGRIAPKKLLGEIGKVMVSIGGHGGVAP